MRRERDEQRHVGSDSHLMRPDCLGDHIRSNAMSEYRWVGKPSALRKNNMYNLYVKGLHIGTIYREVGQWCYELYYPMVMREVVLKGLNLREAKAALIKAHEKEVQ